MFDQKPSPTPTPKSIAAEIAIAGDYAAAREAFRELLRQDEALAAKIRDVGEAARSIGNEGVATIAINRLVAERRMLQEPLRAAREALLPLRAEHAHRVAKALAPLRKETATRLLATLTRLRADAQTLREIAVEIDRAGGAVAPVDLDSLVLIEAAAMRASRKPATAE